MAPEARIDTLLLGCTHYPLLSPVIRDIVGEGIAVIDSASATASALASLIEIHALGTPDGAPGRHAMLTTGDVTAFRDDRRYGSSGRTSALSRASSLAGWPDAGRGAA